MTFVFLHIAKDTKIKDPISQTFVKSINTFYSDSEIIQISDNKTPKLDMVTRVFRFDGDINKIMEFRIKANRELGLQKSAICLNVSVVFSTSHTAVAIGIKGAFDINFYFLT